MSLVIYQSYSNNNYQLFKSTVQNHIDYCNQNKYSLLLDNINYNKFLDVNRMKSLLNIYDIVMTIGSDCIFTNFQKRIQSFIQEEKSTCICLEGGIHSIMNGQITILKRDNNTQQFFNIIDKQQKNNPSAELGYQTCLNNLYTRKEIPNYVQIIQAGVIQSYYSQHVYHTELMKEASWKKGDFICHCLGEDNNDKKRRCEKIMNDLV